MRLKDILESYNEYGEDPLRKANTGTPQSAKELIAFHQGKLDKLKSSENPYKSHIAYHERWIRKLERRLKGR